MLLIQMVQSQQCSNMYEYSTSKSSYTLIVCLGKVPVSYKKKLASIDNYQLRQMWNLKISVFAILIFKNPNKYHAGRILKPLLKSTSK